MKNPLIKRLPREFTGEIAKYIDVSYTHLRAKKCVMKTATTIQENAGDIYAEAKAINDEREAAEEVIDDTVELNEVSEETESTEQ